jgi:hypothetical protein
MFRRIRDALVRAHGTPADEHPKDRRKYYSGNCQ